MHISAPNHLSKPPPPTHTFFFSLNKPATQQASQDSQPSPPRIYQTLQRPNSPKLTHPSVPLRASFPGDELAFSPLGPVHLLQRPSPEGMFLKRIHVNSDIQNSNQMQYIQSNGLISLFILVTDSTGTARVALKGKYRNVMF